MNDYILGAFLISSLVPPPPRYIQVYEKANSVVCDQVRAPHWLHRFIIGRKGQNVQKITQDLPKVHVEFNSDLDKIILEGPPDQVTQAKEAFETFTEDLVRGEGGRGGGGGEGRG